MSFEFEQALRRKCQQNPDLSVLASQWDFDKRLVTDALQVVGLTFPHYSRHDASHSNTILIQLARILGPTRIEKLSATDIWLLLEAAYQHDIGMVVTTEQAKKWWESKEFKAFLETLQMGLDPDLRKAADILLDGTRTSELGHDWPFQVAHARTLVLADYARRQHPLNAERIVRDPSQIGLASPRTTLIPKRLLDILGRICAHHGRTFKETMGLPHRESGLGTDDAHPLFVACMLRLGDLLDLDNNRFCPVMVRSMGLLPSSSIAHFEKHASVTRLDVSPTLVEAEAECPNYESYEVTEQWFSWLREELKDQMATWSKIAPSPDFGALPSVGTISARLTGHIAFEPGRRPRFEVDRESIVSLVKGANIYSDQFSSIRELLQNAVDATLLRLWLEEWSTKPKEELEQLEPKDLRKALEKYPISIRFERVVDAPMSSQGLPYKARWRVTVQDVGTGISLDDVQHMQRIGGSKKNQVRQRNIQSMPEWMRPSGIFGIGLQSVFLFTDSVTLTTRHHDTREALQIELRNSSRKDGAPDSISIKRLDSSDAKRLQVGTTLAFELDVDRVLDWGARHYGMETERVLREYDPICHSDLPYEIAFAKDRVRSFAQACPCPINLDGGFLEREGYVARRFYFDRKTGIEFSIVAVLNDLPRLDLFYRGAPVSNYNNVESLIDVQCDVYAGRADELLKLDREEFTEQGRTAVEDRLRDAIARHFSTYLRELRSRQNTDAMELKVASLYAYLEQLGVDPSLAGDEWREIAISEGGVTVGEVLKRSRVCLRERRVHGGKWFEANVVDVSDERVVIEASVLNLASPSYWLRRVLKRAFGYPSLEGAEAASAKGGLVRVLYTFERGKTSPTLTEAGLRYVLSLIGRNGDLGTRATIPCQSEFKALRYDLEKGNLQRVYWVEPGIRPRMVCPFVEIEGVIRLPNLGKLVEWTARYAEDTSVKPKEVAEALLAFIRYADGVMDKEWGRRRRYSMADVEHELGPWLRG